MPAQKTIINQSVAILCDGNNIERSIQELSQKSNTMVNFDELIPRLLNGRGLNRFIYFREGKHISDKLAERLYSNFYGSVVPCHKSADIPLTIKATQLSSKVDTLIIMSGDSDYIDLVKHLRNEGVRVEIAAVKETCSRYLLEEIDYFHPITRNDWFTYTGKKSSRPRVYSSNKSPNRSSHSPSPVQTKTTTIVPSSSSKPLVNTSNNAASPYVKPVVKYSSKPLPVSAQTVKQDSAKMKSAKLLLAKESSSKVAPSKSASAKAKTSKSVAKVATKSESSKSAAKPVTKKVPKLSPKKK